MQPKKSKYEYLGLVIASIVPGVGAFFAGLFGLVFSIIGNVYMARPQDVSITVNGKYLEGEEAVEHAYTLGKVLATLGGIGLVAALVMGLIFVTLMLIFIHKSRSNENV